MSEGEWLRRVIEAEGPLNVARFMGLALWHPRHGYYATKAPIGAGGDFVTAPEVSQTFGELIGAALAQAWLNRGAPDAFALVEFGPGRGTLTADLWRAVAAVPGFRAAARLLLVEASPALRQAQAERLGGADPAWCTSVADLPGDLPLFCVANEFVDALPVRQYVRVEAGWRERVVGLDAGGELAFGLARMPLPLDAVLRPAQRAAPLGGVVEAAPARDAFAADLAERLKYQGGVAYLIDYGEAEPGHGDTLQAVRGHRKVPPLDAPGTADLTARVDFGALIRAAGGVNTFGPIAQGTFLRRLGIEAWLAALTARAPDRAADLTAGVTRLIAPDAMGTLFQVLALADAGVPPGFDAVEASDAA